MTDRHTETEGGRGVGRGREGEKKRRAVHKRIVLLEAPHLNKIDLMREGAQNAPHDAGH